MTLEDCSFQLPLYGGDKGNRGMRVEDHECVRK
jgi:hypothetical protein